MGKEQQREERERSERTASAEGTPASGARVEDSAREAQAAARTAMEASKAWLRPLRAALPKLQALRGGMGRVPRVDVIERDEDIVVRAAIAGVPKDGIDVAVSDGTLTIRGTAPKADEQGDYSYHELPHGGFERRLALPCEVRAEQAAASIRDGMLELVLPKAERAKQQSIAIR